MLSQKVRLFPKGEGVKQRKKNNSQTQTIVWQLQEGRGWGEVEVGEGWGEVEVGGSR